MGKLLFPLTGSNILIRKLYKRDIPQLYDLETDPNVKRYVGGIVKRPKDEWVAGMRRQTPSSLPILHLAILDIHKTDFVGRATIYPKDLNDGSWEIQILIAKRYWGKRFGREVCELLMAALYRDLSAKAIIAVIDPDNKASRALVQSYGFGQIGVKQTDGWDNGHLIYRHEQAAQ